MMRRILLAGLAIGATFAPVGCRHCCNRSPLSDRIFGGRDTSPAPPPGAILGPPASPRGGTLIPPPPGGLPAAPSTAPPAVPPIGDSGLPPPTVPESRGFRPEKELILPDPVPNGGASAKPADPLLQPPTAALLDEPAPIGRKSDLPPAATPPAGRVASGPVQPAGYTEPRGAVSAGVPGFAVALNGVATGRKPNVDGFDALRTAGYRTVVYLHPPGADVSAARQLAEAKGLRFVALPVAADTLKPAFARFAELVGSRSDRPAFVFDDDGVRAGSLWYLYFRAVEGLGDDAARVRAAPLGLRDAGGDERTKFWLAVQDYLAKR